MFKSILPYNSYKVVTLQSTWSRLCTGKESDEIKRQGLEGWVFQVTGRSSPQHMEDPPDTLGRPSSDTAHMEAEIRSAARRRNWEGFGHGDDACGISSAGAGRELGSQHLTRRERLGGGMRGGGVITGRASTPLALLVGSLAVCDALVLPGFRLGVGGHHGAACASAGRMSSPHQHCWLPRSAPTRSRCRGLSPRMRDEGGSEDPIEIGGSRSSEGGKTDRVMLPAWWTGEAVASFLKQSPKATSPPAPARGSSRDGCTFRTPSCMLGIQRAGWVWRAARVNRPSSPQIESMYEEELAELESSIGYDPDQVPPPRQYVLYGGWFCTLG
jgi:hypothetical protein